MTQTVYADLLFLINFSMDFLCFFLVARLLAKPLPLPRALIASILGGIYSVAALLWATGTVIDILSGILLCFIAFWSRRESFSSFALSCGAFALASVLLGGIMTAVFNRMNRANPPLDSFGDDGSIPFWLFATVTALASLITWLGGSFLRRRAQITQAQVEIHLGEKKVVLEAMCDSGNLLWDALSGRPVIVADLEKASALLPSECMGIVKWNTDALRHLPPSLAARVRLIPTSSVDTDGIMLALRPDSIVIRVGNRTRTAEALIGFAKVRAPIHTCTALLPPELMT